MYRVKTLNYEFNVYCNMEIGYDGYTSKFINYLNVQKGFYKEKKKLFEWTFNNHE